MVYLLDFQSFQYSRFPLPGQHYWCKKKRQVVFEGFWARYNLLQVYWQRSLNAVRSNAIYMVRGQAGSRQTGQTVHRDGRNDYRKSRHEHHGNGDPLRLAGGLSQSSSFAQVLADVLAAPVGVAGVSEASALGAALCAAVGSGAIPDLEQALHDGKAEPT